MAKLHFRAPQAGIAEQVGVAFTRLTVEEAVAVVTLEGQEHELTGTPQQLHDLAVGLLNGLDPAHHRLAGRGARTE